MPALRPALITPETSGREALDQHSETRAMPFGHMPPTPRPTRKRSTSISSCVRTHAPSMAKTE
jgi:hypothetical protein